MTDHQNSSADSEHDYLEGNIGTVAHHLGQPGARLSVSVGDSTRLLVDPGEVLKEVSRRLSAPAQSVGMREALERIAIVCTQHMDRDCNHRMALDGVRQIANDCLDTGLPTANDVRGILASQPSPAAPVETVIGPDGRSRPITPRQVAARAALKVIENPDGVETLDWQIADAVLAALSSSPWEPVSAASIHIPAPTPPPRCSAVSASVMEALRLCEHAIVEGTRDLGLPSVVKRWQVEFSKLREAIALNEPQTAQVNEARRLLAAEDARQDKLQEILETLREQIRLEVAPQHRPEGLFKNIQDAVYAMRGRTRLMEDAAITSALHEPTLVQAIEAEARRYAGMYPQSSDGRNTFVIFADWIASRLGAN